MKIIFRVPTALFTEVKADLMRPHRFAAERVGFLTCTVAALKDAGLLLLAQSFHPVDDDDYIDDPSVGAMMGAAAIRKALQIAYQAPLAMFHVHIHDHSGRPWFSRTDLRETANFVPDFWHVRPQFPHGAIVLSCDAMAGLCWIPGRQQGPIRIQELAAIGAPLRHIRGEK